MPKENQHYVPKLLLRNFTNGTKNQVFAYDKRTDNSFPTNVDNIASEKCFYETHIDETIVTLEPLLSDIESMSAPIIKKIIETRNLQNLEEAEKYKLAFFMAIQYIRTKHQRDTQHFLVENIRDKLISMGYTPEEIKKSGINISDQQSKSDHILSITGLALDFIPSFLKKGWVLHETTNDDPLYISDNPIVKDNELENSPYGNLGLNSPGVQIYLPLSSTLCLDLVCPTIDKELKEVCEESLRLDEELAQRNIAPPLKDFELGNSLIDAYINGTPTLLDKENIRRLNSLQVINSSRFVFCEFDNFSLVREMIDDNDGFRHGKKPKMS